MEQDLVHCKHLVSGVYYNYCDGEHGEKRRKTKDFSKAYLLIDIK
jgi:hypothetical protein